MSALYLSISYNHHYLSEYYLVTTNLVNRNRTCLYNECHWNYDFIISADLLRH